MTIKGYLLYMNFITYFKSTFSEPQKLTVKIALTLLSISSPLLLSNSTWAQTSANTKELSQTQQLESKSASNVQRNLREINAALKDYNSPDATSDAKRRAIEVFQKNLKNQDKQMRIAATNALYAIGTSVENTLDDKSLDDLKNLLKKEEDSDVFDSAIAAIQSINATPAIPELIDISMNEESKGLQVRSAALEALATVAGNIDQEQAEKVIPFLLDSLKDRSVGKVNLRISAAEALAQMHTHLHNEKAINILKDSLKDPAWRVRRFATDALGNTGVYAKSAIPEIIEAYNKEQNYTMRQSAIKALGNIGEVSVPEGALKVLPVLNQALSYKNSIVRNSAAKAIGDIAAGFTKFTKSNELKPKDSSNTIRQFKTALENIEKLKKEEKDDLNSAIQNIKSSLRELQSRQFFKQTLTNPLVWGPAIYLATVFGIFWLHPLWLLKIDKALKSVGSFKLPYVDKEISLSWLLLMLKYHPRVLDAWVEAHVKSAQEAFEQKDTVSNRNVYIPTPVVKNGKTIAQLTGQDLRPTFKRQRACMLIQGEGGVGKTTLSCQIAKWAMSRDETERLCKHKMLPVLIEEELEIPDEIEIKSGLVRKSPFIPALMKAIQGQLQDLTDEMESISEELLERLLRERRILVIVDHLSEMSQETRKAIHPDSPDFYINALVVTSRSEEKLGQVTKTTLKPLLIQGDRLSSFMEAYLVQANKRDLFTDPEFFQACSRLSQMVGGRKVTALLAKLYADQLIAAKVEEIQQVPLLTPGNIPDLMLGYINELNRSVTENKLSDRTVQQDAKVIAWECLKQTFRPTTARRDAVLATLGGNDAEIRLQYLEKRLRLIQTIGAAQDKIRFALDPLAEYLAAMQVLKLNQNNQQLWDEFWHQATIASEDIELIAGFLLALQDCSQANGQEIDIPPAIADKLSQLSDSTFAAKNNSLEQILCSSCGHHNLINNKFCTKCGMESQLTVNGTHISLN